MNLLAALSSKGQPVWIKWWIFWLCQVQRPVCLNEEMYMLAVPGPRASLAESSGEVEIIWFRIGLLNWNRPPEGITPAGPIITPSAARSKLCHRPVCISLQSIIVLEIVNKEQTCMPTGSIFTVWLPPYHKLSRRSLHRIHYDLTWNIILNVGGVHVPINIVQLVNKFRNVLLSKCWDCIMDFIMI